MARPRQDGLLYFSFDTDFFYADKRIKRLHSRYGNDGILFYIYLLTEIYRNGYYIRWDEESIEDAMDDLHLTEGLIEQIMTFLVSRSLLTKSILANSDTIITSPGIQKRYQEAAKARKRDTIVDVDIWLLSQEETADCIKVTQNEYKSEKNQSKSEKNQSKSEKNQSKSEKNPLKENKRNKSKEKQRECVQRIEEFIAAYPKECSRHLTEIAYCDLIMDGVETEGNLVACAENYAEACKILKTPERYIKNAENFIREFVFEKYLPGRYKKPMPNSQKKGKPNQFNQFQQNEYDFEELENELLSN